MNTKTLSCLLVVSTCLSLASCHDDDGNERKIIGQQEYELTIGSRRVPGTVYGGCGNTYVWDVYAGKKEAGGEWTAFGDLYGFEFQAGNEYRIQLEETTYEDHLMGEPVWTEYSFRKVLAKEAKNTEDLPEHLLPARYYEDGTFVPEYRFAVEAGQKELIEKDLKDNPPVMAGANVIVYGGQLSRWIALDNDGKMLGNGNLKHVNVHNTSFPDSYKLLPLQGVQGFQRWTFMDDNGKETMAYDTFIGTESVSRTPSARMVPCLYKDLTDVYKARYPAAGVKAVVYSLRLVMK